MLAPASDEIAERFSAAADHYHEHNSVQRMSAASLLAQFQPRGCVLDIGAGPGTAFSTQSNGEKDIKVFALDIALGMLQKLKQSFPRYQVICADAEQLPLLGHSIDSIYSNLALQWCGNFPAAIAEFERVLKVGGECHLSIVADGSLAQLSTLGLRVNGFLTIEVLKAAFCHSKWQFIEAELIPMTVYFESLKDLLYSIKGVGASVHSSQTSLHSDTQQVQLRGRKDWQALVAKAQNLRQAEGIPLTYQIAQLRVRRL
ncbi:malonyl-ACP O-methyltransferase BioC [Shewanella acanthi]|uniref:malonyl-ACP O-methyltransferase BioC n=1 Tax=Shewanella acanthi TaxID=2864212 RepID=UPI001C654CF7|nr:malonyl-ACP O-methyltransferase BioC [Shewanella acanthi]QYJ80625.1 malonyl-ACP O-methyltransferase BioC [Shewanella acanthi]